MFGTSGTQEFNLNDEEGEGFHILLKYLSDVIVQRHLFYREVGDVGK